MTEINEQTEAIPEELLEDRDIKEAVNFVFEASLSKEEKLHYEKNWDRISSEKTLVNGAKEEGMAEAKAEIIAEGLEKGKAEIAQKAKAMGMPIKDISSLTGLSEQEIEAL